MMKKTTNAVLALGIIALLGASMVYAFPMGEGFGFGKADLTEDERAQMDAFRDTISQAIENDDYEAWKESHMDRFSEERFEEAKVRHTSMTEVRELRDTLNQAIEDGDEELAEELRGELAQVMPKNFQEHRGQGMGKGQKMGSGRQGDCLYN